MASIQWRRLRSIRMFLESFRANFFKGMRWVSLQVVSHLGNYLEEFFDKFISEASPVFSFQEFHKMRGDTDFKMSSWQKDEKLGYSRDLSFVSPLKSTLLHYS